MIRGRKSKGVGKLKSYGRGEKRSRDELVDEACGGLSTEEIKDMWESTSGPFAGWG